MSVAVTYSRKDIQQKIAKDVKKQQEQSAQKKTNVDPVTGQTTTTSPAYFGAKPPNIAQPVTEAKPAPIPLPYPYWSAGKEVAGSIPYLSGEPAKPAYVAPEGYVIEKTEIVTIGPRPPMTVQEALHSPPTKEMRITLKPEPPPKSIGEQIASVSPFDIGLYIAEYLTGKKLTPEQKAKAKEIYAPISDVSGIPTIKGTPTEVLGGFIGAIESPVYAVASAWGAKGLPQPKTTSGALLSSAILSVEKGELTKSPQYEELEKESSAYATGSFMGDILLFIGATKGTQYLFSGVSKVTPVLARQTIAGSLARASASATLGAAGGYVFSGGKPEEAGKGAALAFGLSLGYEWIARPLIGEVRARLPERLGGTPRLQEGAPTIGKTGEPVKTYVSEPLEKLDQKQLQIVADVTQKPVGTSGVTIETMVDDYVNQFIPTGHGTLKPESFELSIGGKTVLKGYPSESMGFRKEYELYHFYSAPGSEKFVTVYGGYMGIGEGYSGVSPKIVVGGKPTALVTTETYISDFSRRASESLDDWLERISSYSGKTGIAPETLAGRSAEQQFITPTAYTRKGVELPGSLFVSEGKVGTFQIKQTPEGIIGKIPIIRSMLSQYTTLNVFKGHYAPIATVIEPKTISIGRIETTPTIHVPSQSVMASPLAIVVSPSLISVPKSASKISASVSNIQSRMSSAISKMTSPSKMSIPSYPSMPSYPSLISEPSKPSYPSKPSQPSYPSKPSQPSQPSLPSKPPTIISPLITSLGSRLKPKLIKGGLWRRREHPIPTPEEITNNLLGKRRGKR